MQSLLNSLIASYSQLYADPARRDSLVDSLRDFFSRRDIDFVAVDGTCSKDVFQDFVVFFGGAYGCKGSNIIGGQSKPGQL